jgi:hypothetical protein
MDKAKERADLAIAAEREAAHRFILDAEAFRDWQNAKSVAKQAIREFESAQSAYLEALSKSK